MSNLIVQQEITVDTNAYAAGDCIGGLQTIECARIVKPSDKVVHSVVVSDAAAQSAALSIIFFKKNPAASTFTNNAALTIADADLKEIVGVVSVLGTDYTAFASNSAACVTAIGLPIDADVNNLYFTIRCDGTPTYSAVTDLQVTINFL